MRFIAAARYAGACVDVLAGIGCGATTPTQPAPVYDMKTETFSGALNTGGTSGFPFTVVNPGTINVSITQLGPVNTLTMRLGLGLWNSATPQCEEQLATTAATLNQVFTGDPSGPGEYCVAIGDTGNVQVETQFMLTVTHY